MNSGAVSCSMVSSIDSNFKIPHLLTHWGRVTHICVGKLIIIGSDNGLSPGRCQAIIWTNARILLIGPSGTNFSEIWIEIDISSFKKTHLKISSAKCRPSCLGLNVLRANNGPPINHMLNVARSFTIQSLCSYISMILEWQFSITTCNGLLLDLTVYHTQWLLVDEWWQKLTMPIYLVSTTIWPSWAGQLSSVAASGPRACQTHRRQSVAKHRLSSQIGAIPDCNFRSLYRKIS